MERVSLEGVIGIGCTLVVGYLGWKNIQKMRSKMKVLNAQELVQVIKPTGNAESLRQSQPNLFTIFTAGSIEMGKAVDWQTKFCEMLMAKQARRMAATGDVRPVVVFNPRRDDWNMEWNNTKHHPLLNEQIKWELDNLEGSNLIVLHFEPDTISPVSLLEMGIFAHSGKIIVHCPDEYFRVENVVQVCKYYNIPMVNSIQQLADVAMEYVYY